MQRAPKVFRMTVTLQPEIAGRLKNYAASSYIPKTKIINLALASYLEKKEKSLEKRGTQK